MLSFLLRFGDVPRVLGPGRGQGQATTRHDTTRQDRGTRSSSTRNAVLRACPTGQVMSSSESALQVARTTYVQCRASNVLGRCLRRLHACKVREASTLKCPSWGASTRLLRMNRPVGRGVRRALWRTGTGTHMQRHAMMLRHIYGQGKDRDMRARKERRGGAMGDSDVVVMDRAWTTCQNAMRERR